MRRVARIEKSISSPEEAAIPVRIGSRTVSRRALLGGLAGVAAVGGGTGLARASSRTENRTTEPSRFRVARDQTYNIGRIAGTDSMNQTATKWQVGGTDLGSMFVHKGRLVFLFGDTEAPADLPADHRDNVLAWSTDTDPSDGVTFDGMVTEPDRPDHAKELLDHSAVGAQTTVIPTYGIALGDRMVMHYMGVDQWGDPGHWTLNQSGLAYSDDDGQTWTVSDVVWPDGGGNFGQVALVNSDGFTYLYGIPGGRFGGIALGRVPADALFDMGQYEYWSDGTWVADPGVSTIIVPAPVGELSVRWNSHYQAWLMMYLNEDKAAVVLRTADQLTGPWSAEQTIVTASDFPQLYAPFIPPMWNDGPDIYFALSQFTPYSVHWWHTALE